MGAAPTSLRATGVHALRMPAPIGLRRRDIAVFLAPLAVGLIGSVPTASAIPTWYRGLEKPDWNPPDAVFGPVWTTLYAMMGAAMALVAREPNRPATDRATAVFGLQLALNLAWSLVFFGNRDPRGALVVIGLLWVSIVATIIQFWQVRRAAALLLVPYLAWVSFASLLNLEIVRRNP